jgi:hypothetical protein
MHPLPRLPPGHPVTATAAVKTAMVLRLGCGWVHLLSGSGLVAPQHIGTASSWPTPAVIGHHHDITISLQMS